MLAVSLSLCTLTAQSSSIQGAISSSEGAVSFATVVLYSSADSTLIKADYTNEQGLYKLDFLSPGDYYVEVSFVGYESYISPVFTLKTDENKELDTVTLSTASTSLEEVVVETTKPLVQVLPDRTVFNVEGNVNSTGNDGLELLRKSPGVVVDNNENIILQGKNGVMIYIDGKPSNLGGDDLVAYLKTLQSSDIEAIEIITSPSSKYDAEGNAGIINIKLIRDKSLGTNGSVNLGLQQGVTPKINGGIRLNTRRKNVALFGSYNYNDGKYRNTMELNRIQGTDKLIQESVMDTRNTSHNYRAGADFYLGKKHTVGVIASGYFSDSELNSNIFTELYTLPTAIKVENLRAKNEVLSSNSSHNFNLNYVYKIKEQTQLSVDLDYGTFESEAESFQPNIYSDPITNQVTQRFDYSNFTPTDIDIYTAKADLEAPLSDGKLGLGVKYASVITDNAIDFYNVIDDEKILDVNRTNDFQYTENVFAAYSNYSAQKDKLGYQIGLRLEHTYSLGDLDAMVAVADEQVERSYTNLFPNLGLTYQLNEKNMLRLNYSRRLDRPNYQNLNPFEFRLDELTFQKGNPFLNPQYSNSIELTHQFNYRLNTSLSFTRTTDLMTEITDTAGTRQAFITNINLASQDVISLNVSYPFAPTKWWNVFANVSAFRISNSSIIEEGKEIDITVTAANVFMQHSFNLPKGVNLELSGFYASPSVWGGNFKTNSIWSMDFGAKKSILDGKGNLKLSVSDIFFTQPWVGKNSLGELQIDAMGTWESRRVRLNFTYNFGSKDVKSARKRSTGLEDEASRISTGN